MALIENRLDCKINKVEQGNTLTVGIVGGMKYDTRIET